MLVRIYKVRINWREFSYEVIVVFKDIDGGGLKEDGGSENGET